MKKNKIVYVVVYFYWDYEWYFIMEDFNILLIENLDYFLNVLEIKDFFVSYFFDG